MSHLLACRYTLTGSLDGVIRLWASGNVFARAQARPDAAATSVSCATGTSASSEEAAADEDSATVVQGTLLHSFSCFIKPQL